MAARFSRFVVLVALVIAPAAADAKPTVVTEGGTVVLENATLRAVISPARGGALAALTFKPKNIALLAGPSVTEAVVLPSDRRVPLADIAWSAATAATETAASCTLTVTVPPLKAPPPRPKLTQSDPYFADADPGAIKIEKRYELRDGAGLDVSYRLTNTGNTAVPLALAMRQAFAEGKPADNRLVFPTLEGAAESPVAMARMEFKASPYFSQNRLSYDLYDFSAGWVGVLSSRSYGVVRSVDPRQLSFLRLTADGSAATEAVSTRTTLAPGGSRDIKTAIVALSNQSTVTAMGAEVALGIALNPVKEDEEATPDDLNAGPEDLQAAQPRAKGSQAVAIYPAKGIVEGSVLVSAAQAQQVDVEISARPLRGAPQVLQQQQIKVDSGAAVAVPFKFTPAEPGTWMIYSTVKCGGAVATGARSLVVEAANGFYLQPIVAERNGTVHRAPHNAFPPPVNYQPTMQVATPHLPFARPYARGPVRTLFLWPYWVGREVVEFAQQLDMQYDFVGISRGKIERDINKLSATPEEQLFAKRQLVKPHDVIVAGQTWVYWPEEVRQEILRQVREEGAGLFCVQMGGLDKSLQDLRKKAKPADFVGPGVLTVAYGKGRIAWAGDAGLVTQMQRVGRSEQNMRALLWASGKAPPLTISSNTATIDNSEAPGKTTLTLQNRGAAPVAGKLEVVVRQALNRQYPLYYDFFYNYATPPWWEDRGAWSQEVAVPPDERSQVQMPLPALPAGSYNLHATLRDGVGKVVSWAWLPLTVESTATIEAVWLAKPGGKPLRNDFKTQPLPQQGFKPGETLQLRAVLAPGNFAGALGCSLRLTDGDGRMLYHEKKPAVIKGEAPEAEFSVPLQGAVHPALYATITAWGGERPLAETRTFIPVQREPEREAKFQFIQLDNEGWQPFRLMGITHYYNGSEPYRALEAAAQGIKFQGGGGEIMKPKKGVAEDLNDAAPDPEAATTTTLVEEERVFRRPDCFNNPKTLAAALAQIRDDVPYFDRFGQQGHMVVDEYVYGSLQACECEFCQPAYRAFLKKTYGSIERLNQEYASKYAAWDDIKIYNLPGNGTTDIAPADWPRVIDVQWWKIAQLKEFVARIIGEGEKLSENTTFGYSGVMKMDPANGNDFWQMAQAGKYHIIYRDWPEWASFVGSQAVRQWRWYQDKYNPSAQAQSAWEILLHGEPGTGIFTSDFFGYPSCYADGTVIEGPQAYFKEQREINDGPARLLLGHDVRDGIAIEWSSPDFFASALQNWNRPGARDKDSNFGEYKGMEWPRKVAHLLHGSAVGPHSLTPYYVSHGQLEAGSLGLFGTPKIIFLPYSTAMSQAEADTLKKYVQNGGTLVATLAPATRDIHGKPYAAPLLDELFGVKSSHAATAPVFNGSAEKPGVKVVIDKGFDAPLTLQPLLLPGATVEATTATAWGRYTEGGRNAPAVLVNSAGKGRTVLLNFLPLGTNDINGATLDVASQSAVATMVQKLCEQAGVKPWATVSTSEKPGGPRLNRFVDGDNVYLGVLEDWGQPPDYFAGRDVVVTLPKPYHVYDVRRGAYVGQVAQIKPRFATDWPANIYACLPYRVTALEITPAAGVVKAGADVALKVAVKADAAPGRHVIRVAVSNPAGERVEQYGYNFEAPGGAGTVHVPLALNDPPGEWKVQCTDVATGVTATMKFSLAR